MLYLFLLFTWSICLLLGTENLWVHALYFFFFLLWIYALYISMFKSPFNLWQKIVQPPFSIQVTLRFYIEVFPATLHLALIEWIVSKAAVALAWFSSWSLMFLLNHITHRVMSMSCEKLFLFIDSLMGLRTMLSIHLWRYWSLFLDWDLIFFF